MFFHWEADKCMLHNCKENLLQYDSCYVYNEASNLRTLLHLERRQTTKEQQQLSDHKQQAKELLHT